MNLVESLDFCEVETDLILPEKPGVDIGHMCYFNC